MQENVEEKKKSRDNLQMFLNTDMWNADNQEKTHTDKCYIK